MPRPGATGKRLFPGSACKPPSPAGMETLFHWVCFGPFSVRDVGEFGVAGEFGVFQKVIPGGLEDGKVGSNRSSASAPLGARSFPNARWRRVEPKLYLSTPALGEG